MSVLLMTKLKNMFKEVDKDNSLEYHLKNININGSKRGCSGFIKNGRNNKIVYINTEICCGIWLPPILYREAKSLKDFKGGINNFCDNNKIVSNVIKMLEA